MEILITMAVIGFAALLTAPALMSLTPSMELKSATGDIYAALQEAKVLAIKTNKTVNVQFTAAGYTLFEPFTDTDLNGAFTAGENFIDLDGDAAHSAVKSVNYATDYDYGIQPGFQAVTDNNSGDDWNGAACQQLNNVAFNSRGLAAITPVAVAPALTRVYLESKNQDICYAIEVRVAGSINTRKFNGSIW